MNPVQAEFSSRRQKMLSAMVEGIAIIPTAAEAIRNRDSHYPYRFDSSFYYLTGFKEPDAVLVLLAGSQAKSILFCRDKDPEREIWDGFRYGPAAACEQFGFDEAYSIDELDAKLLSLLAKQPKVYFSLGLSAAWDARLTACLNKLATQSRSGVNVPDAVCDPRKLIDAMRLYKSPFELALMRQSADIAATAHNRAMQYVKPGMMEYQLEAECLHEFYRQGAQAPAYTSIVAGGANACTLHYNANNALLRAGDLVLIDAGCELDGYASDISRTFPINGKFSGAQKDLYELVLTAQSAAIAQVHPANDWDAPHQAALAVLAQGFIDLKLCQGSLQAVLESGDYRRFYMHRTGHWLGLDVHDVGEYQDRDQQWARLGPGMTLTVEPGCYIHPAANVAEHFWHTGIRIEDDVLVTATGCEVLTVKAVKSVADIEALMSVP